MGFAQWFWRLFFVFAGLIVAHVLVVTLLVVQSGANVGSASFPYAAVWLTAGVVLAAGAVAMWFCVQRIVAPLSELTKSVRAASASDSGPHLVADNRDEVGVLTGAFDQMQRDLAKRLDQIQQNNQRLETVLSSMAEGVLAIGPDKTILLANDAGRQLLDFATPNPVGRSLLEVTRSRPVHEAAAQAFRAVQPVVIEFDAPGVSRRTLSLRATRLPGEPCPGVMIVLHDMTELRRLENLRRELVANVSHELKTPLSAIKGYAETLRLGAVNDSEHNLHFVRRIEEQADRLHELILDILQIARVESGQESFELADVPMADLIEQCGEQFAELAAAKQIQLVVEPPLPDVAVIADEEGLRTILSNLVDNGLKYTSAGGTVAVRVRADEATVTIEVEDTGIGIAEKDQARIFERFYRVDKARSRELGGTGLGLSIVKHLSLAFGGNVSVESQHGRGSTFRVQLPRAAGNRP
jgi:two-component system, OmpR family, phosphate regulon sensor histidine kinase PhoR